MGKYLSILGGSFVTQVLNSMIPGTKKADSPKMFLFKVRHPISLFVCVSIICEFWENITYLEAAVKPIISISTLHSIILYGICSKRVEIYKSTSKKIFIYSFCYLKVGYHCFLQHIEICGCPLYIYRNSTS